jgi:hypothetical protein
LSRAITASGLAAPPSQPASATILQGRLIVRRPLSSPIHLSSMPGSKLIELRLEGMDPREDVRMMNAVLRALEAEASRLPEGASAVQVIQSPQVTP